MLAEQGAMPASRAVDVICQVASALGAAHAQGLVHRAALVTLNADDSRDVVGLMLEVW